MQEFVDSLNGREPQESTWMVEVVETRRIPIAIAAKETETQKEAKRFLLGTVNTLRNSLKNLGCDVARSL